MTDRDHIRQRVLGQIQIEEKLLVVAMIRVDAQIEVTPGLQFVPILSTSAMNFRLVICPLLPLLAAAAIGVCSSGV